MATDKVYTIETDIGWMAVCADHRALLGLSLGHATAPQAVLSLAANGQFLGGEPPLADRPQLSWQTDLIKRLIDFASGQRVEFGEVRLDLSYLTSFRRKVVKACRRIPFGETVSYSQLAMRAGSPRAARAVGTTMARNRFPIVVPCHRVIGSDGTLRGFSSPRGIALKGRLLTMENTIGSLDGSLVP